MDEPFPHHKQLGCPEPSSWWVCLVFSLSSTLWAFLLLGEATAFQRDLLPPPFTGMGASTCSMAVPFASFSNTVSWFHGSCL